MRLSCEMLSMDGEAFPNKVRFVEHGNYIYIEFEGTHDGTKVCTCVKVERAVFAYHMKASGVLS